MKKIFGFASVFALAAGFSLSSCSSDDVAEEMNPNYDGNAEVVKTQFSISVPGSVKSSRMTEEETQSGAHASDFQGMKNINILTFKGAKSLDESGLASATIAGSFILDPIGGPEIANNAKAKVYNDVKIDLGVDRMLFYGESNLAQQQGKLSKTFYFSNGGNVGEISFSPVRVDAAAKKFKADAQGIKILEVLNSLTNPSTGWKNAADETELKNLYNQFITLKNGSASIVVGALSNLYTALSAIVQRVDTGHEIATSLLAILDESFNSEDNGDTGFTLTWKPETAVNEFPENLNLPIGVALLSFSGDSFAYDVTTGGSHSGGKKHCLVNDIVSPAALYYYVNSDLAVSDNNQNLEEQKSSNWSDIMNGYNDERGIVTFTTRSVSMRQPVQYAVGQLRTSVRVKDGEIRDFAGSLIGVTNYPVTGILIGGQKSVDWKFEQLASETSYTIFDNNMVEDMIAETYPTYSNVNSTLVLESAPQEDVYIAVEFVNNGDRDFVSKDGIVKKGSKFYLVAKLKYEDRKDESDSGVQKVFQKDYFTNAKLTISNLENAYITIPDLRASKLEFGLSVNLEWSQGLTFETDFD